MTHPQLPDAAVDLICEFEGLRLRAYLCPGGKWTIGYGHTSAAGPPRVVAGLSLPDEAEARRILAQDLTTFASAVRPLVTATLTDAQFGALVSFAFNVGLAAFRKSSVLTSTNAGLFADVPACLARYRRGGGKVLPGLVRRRAAEGALWRGEVAR